MTNSIANQNVPPFEGMFGGAQPNQIVQSARDFLLTRPTASLMWTRFAIQILGPGGEYSDPSLTVKLNWKGIDGLFALIDKRAARSEIKGTHGVVYLRDAYLFSNTTITAVVVAHKVFYDNESLVRARAGNMIIDWVSTSGRSPSLLDPAIEIAGEFYYTAYVGDVLNALASFTAKKTSTVYRAILSEFILIARELLRLNAWGVVYLDLKPENILVSEKFKFALSDFDGVAQLPMLNNHINPQWIAALRNRFKPETLEGLPPCPNISDSGRKCSLIPVIDRQWFFFPIKQALEEGEGVDRIFYFQAAMKVVSWMQTYLLGVTIFETLTRLKRNDPSPYLGILERDELFEMTDGEVSNIRHDMILPSLVPRIGDNIISFSLSNLLSYMIGLRPQDRITLEGAITELEKIVNLFEP